ncbi:uncharacterized protein LOC124185158 [Neodiprion fabricii]|uniref:uncharacterized protein LOC124185158 n=1 Tax=Neodiprion fabricii TaxID=2872261 RepID=UPI001ED94F74|nr:uncharacterized protein LOC124185158 [Neodiprion fabricii]
MHFLLSIALEMARPASMVSKNYLTLSLGFAVFTSVIASDLRRILPLDLKIREGEDLQLRLTSALPNMVSCYVKTPLLTSFNLESGESDSSNRINYWTENGECGVRARSVTKDDTGRWRLTAKNASHTLVDATFVEVLDKVSESEKSYDIESGLEYTLMLKENTKYCSVDQPHSEVTLLVGGECKVELQQPTAAIRGNWKATTGVVGQLQEIPAKVELNVYQDQLAVGYVIHHDSNTINAYCNLRDSEKELEFCRFVRPDSTQTGYQLSEGLHSGRYGYYGAGLKNGECGITIETPTQEDYGQWQCSVGVKDEVPFGTYVQISSGANRAAVVRGQALPTEATATYVHGKLQLRCEANVPISYCWFLGPDGEIFTPTQSLQQEDLPYKYIGNGFGKGQCGMEIKTAEVKHKGQWTCHMGPSTPGFELISTIDVAVSETPLAAKNRHISTISQRTLTLECRTVPEKISISYCRFLMPDGTGIHISDEISENNPLLLGNAHYSFYGDGLRLGGCGLKVDRILPKHLGTWTCAARLEVSINNSEVFDTIVVSTTESSSQNAAGEENLTASATAGIVSGVLILAGLLAAGSVYMVKWIKARQLQDNTSRLEVISVSTDESRRSSSSTNSGISLADMAPRNGRA